MRFRYLVWLLAPALAALGAADALSAPHHKPAKPAPAHPTAAVDHKPASAHQATAADHHKRGVTAKGKHGKATAQARQDRFAGNVPQEPLPPDLAAAKQAMALLRQGKMKDAGALAATIGDPVAQKLVEWTLLRYSDSDAGFDRYVAFIRANPDWPSVPLLRRRAEARLWQERRDAATVHGFLGDKPTSAIGRLALARALIGEGDRAGAERQVRGVWRSAEMSSELEAAVLNTFPDMLARADDVARMDKRIGAKDFDGAMRVAKRLGNDNVAIVKACSAAEANSKKDKALLDAVPGEARVDLGYVLCRVHSLVRQDNAAEAAKLVLAASSADLQYQDTDEWWRERRTIARSLIDRGDAQTAYQVVRGAAPPANPYYRSEFHFMAGWIALRFLADPAAALEHFTHIDEGMTDPIVQARAAYWRGRAAEAAGEIGEMRTEYEAAAGHPTAFYGQLARARLGLGNIPLRPPPTPVTSDTSETLRAADILYRIGEGDLVLEFVSDLAEESSDPALISAIGQLTGHYNDAQAMLLVGKTALARGLPMEQYAFPDIGVPDYTPISPPLDRCIVYSIVRTESSFDQHDMSPAKAVGLMQVTPEAGRDTAKRFGVVYDWNRLVSDPVYNTQMGVAEVAALYKEYAGSFVMTFAGYNAGRGRVRQWVAQHGDPRDPKIDAVDWVERIPLAETRNYVERVMENLQVYRQRFGAGIATTEPNLHRASAVELRVEPASLMETIRH